MGGDGAPDVVIDATRQVLSDRHDLEIVLVGPEDRLLPALAGGAGGKLPDRLTIHHAEHVLAADVSAAAAIRRGRGSSLWQAIDLAEQGRVDAVVSGGSTGALMALSRQKIGMLPGIERPALMAALPSRQQQLVWMLDLGANINVDAPRLLEFAQLGAVAVKVIENRAPRIGLLNIGSEPGKGPDVIREAARLIEAQETLDYAGFVEADQVFAGAVDLVVCDGFSGNILLKGAEGAIRLLFERMREEFQGTLGGMVARRGMKRLHDRLDPARHNGAPMLGVRKTVIKSHGSACSRGFARAISLAALEVERDLINRLDEQLWASY
ncbi:phosphate acyltransferase [Wenzhouxiangella marina]|uniref:Phosphate acyltransferase n=2 Tax=Wenzhouxiangella marina TaxID=1579979 RepID=A0A0K0XW83_9GAMM|nr:phosphate acyltransferase [Wenzhouxiangella marina]